MKETRKSLSKAKRIVIKIGTSTLTYDTGKVNFSRLDRLARTVSDLINQGREIVLVTSGAIGVGVGRLNLKEKPKSIPEKQAVAAVGQCELMHIYSKLFSEYGHTVAQILLTKDVVENQYSRNNVVNTFETLMKRGIVPIVNENDTVSIEEIENMKNFGDNDTLSAVVASLIRADALILLSDIDGLYNGDPRKNNTSELIPVIYEITPEIEAYAGGSGTKRGTGGMATKISAAKLATSSGVHMVITNGEQPEIIQEILSGKEIGSLFIAKNK